MATVRALILQAITEGIAALAGVGAVLDAAEVLPGEDPGDAIARAVGADGKHAVELVFMDDEADEQHAAQDVEAWRFRVVAVVHLPDVLAPGVTPAAAAAAVHALIYALCTGGGGNTWGGRALDTRCRGGGGVAIGLRGTRETVSVFDVHYRHRYGNPEVAV